MTSPLLIGNDIVDLNDPENDNTHHKQRFVARVFTSAEQQLLSESDCPHLLLWALWAAKEAAFKILKKTDRHAVFAHSAFEVHPSGTVDSTIQSLKGEIKVNDTLWPLQWQFTAEYVHCLALNRNAVESDLVHSYCCHLDKAKMIDVTLSPRELQSTHSSASKAVRMLLKSTLHSQKICDVADDLEIVREQIGDIWQPPALWCGDQKMEKVDISMSHDGNFVACAYASGSDTST